VIARALVLVVLVVAAACGGGATSAGPAIVIAVDAPFSSDHAVATQIAQGVELAVAQLNAAGGLAAASGSRPVKVLRLDNASSPSRGAGNVRDALARGAVAIVDDGTAVDAAWREAGSAGVPVGIAGSGASGLVDPHLRPGVFRVAPTDRAVAFRIAEYLGARHLRFAIVSDDSPEGTAGRAAIEHATATTPDAVAGGAALSAGVDPSPALVRVQQQAPQALVVWAAPRTIAAVIAAVRASGWTVPIVTSRAGADPLVREALAAHPAWVEGTTVATGRLTAEQGPAPFRAFQSAYETAYGPDLVGVRTADGSRVALPPEAAMYAYDLTRIFLRALQVTGGRSGAALLAAVEHVQVTGANGDARGFNTASHEGVVDDDVAFARITDEVLRPVRDDPLSSSLPYVEQRRK
jgi:ABC-type branched-subunit amino acid transport system substrate-binding protein